MGWKSKVNVALEEATGYRFKKTTSQEPPPPPAPEIRPPADPEADRLLTAPIFVLSPPRSGSTLLRVLLNSHSQLHAPHEMHIRRLTVNLTTDPVHQAMEALGHNQSDIEHILWDRMLHRELVRSGKPFIVDKTPSNSFAWKRIATCWPDARFIFLLRHPASVVRSWHEGDPDERPMEEAVRHTLRFMRAVEDARKAFDGLTLTYENLTGSPEETLRRVCDFLDVPWEPSMLSYGDHKHGGFVKGIGDWKEKIRTGSVQPGRPLPRPDEVPHDLLPVCEAWGYLGNDRP
jgi:sulfotransferase family protein